MAIDGLKRRHVSAAAGPVVAAACVLPAGGLEGVDGIDDSKRLSEKRREALYEQLVRHPQV